MNAALQVIWRDGIVAAQAIVIILVAPVFCETILLELVAAFVPHVPLIYNVRVS